MSDTFKKSMDDSMDYVKGNSISLEIHRYKLKKVPNYNGKEIRKIREKIELPRNVMADILGVSVRTIEKWEIDGAKPNGSARRLLQLLEKNPMFIINSIENLAMNT